MEGKLKLEVEALDVDSFAAEIEENAEGTVEAYLTWTDPRVCEYTNNWCCTVNDAYCTRAQSCAAID